MSGVWNILYPPRVSYRSTIKNLLHSGQELYGTVIQHGVNNKTVKVKVSYQFWNCRLKMYMGRSSKFTCHDEENFCVVGDKVVIKQTEKFSVHKYYYVRNVVVPYPRDEFYTNQDNQMDNLMKELQESLQTKSVANL